MLQPQNRLRDSVEIMETLRQGARFHISFCDIYVKPAPGDKVRLACIVGKRVHASAVKRHLAQRRLRAACAQLLPAIKAPYNIVIVGTDSVILHMDFNSLVRELYYGILQGVE